MKIEFERVVTDNVNVVTVRMDLPVRYEEEDMPNDYPHREGEMWSIEVDADTGQIRDWPQGVEPRNLGMKVTDSGTYKLIDDAGQIAVAVNQDYVPGFIPGEYGDYVKFSIDASGVITNWRKAFTASKVMEHVASRE